MKGLTVFLMICAFLVIYIYVKFCSLKNEIPVIHFVF